MFHQSLQCFPTLPKACQPCTTLTITMALMRPLRHTSTTPYQANATITVSLQQGRAQLPWLLRHRHRPAPIPLHSLTNAYCSAYPIAVAIRCQFPDSGRHYFVGKEFVSCLRTQWLDNESEATVRLKCFPVTNAKLLKETRPIAQKVVKLLPPDSGLYRYCGGTLTLLRLVRVSNEVAQCRVHFVGCWQAVNVLQN